MTRSSAILATFVAGLAPLAAVAAETAESTSLSRIVVQDTIDDDYLAPVATTATKTETPLMQTPMKVEVITQQALRDMGITSRGLSDALAVAGIAGLGMEDLGNSFFYRGFASTTTLWNGFRVEDMGTNVNGVNGGVWMDNVERLELLRGPSSILYGRAEPGGAVNVKTKRPLDDGFIAVNSGFGSASDVWISADMTGPLDAAKALRYRLNLSYEAADSWYRFGPDYRSTGVAPALDYRISPRTTLHFEGQFRNLEGGPNQPYVPIDFTTNALANVDPEDTLMPGAHSEFDQTRVSLGVDHAFNDDWSLSWRYMYNDADNPLTILSWVIGMYYPVNPGDPLLYTRGLVSNRSGQQGHATMLDLVGHVETGFLVHTLLFGIDYYDTQSHQDANFDCWCLNFDYDDPPPVVFPEAYDSFYNGGGYISFWDVDQEEFSLYGQDQIRLPRDVHLLLGMRYQHLKERSLYVVPPLDVDIPPDGIVDQPEFVEDIPYKRNILLPRAALLWQPVPSISLYYSYAENAGASQGLQADGKPIEPEMARQHEVGAKAEFLGGRLIGSVALFQLTKDNIAAADTAHPGFNLAVGRVRSEGYELSLQGALNDDWNLLSTFNYARPYVEKGTTDNGPATSLQPLFISTGSLLPYFSQHSFSLLTSYRLPAGRTGTWRIGGGFNRFSAATMDENSTIGTRPYEVASVFASFETRIGGFKTSLQLNVDNLFGEDYLMYQGDVGQFIGAPDPETGYGNYVGGNWGDPRQYKLGVRVEF